ncbi:MAG: RNA polymerase sigma-70 factor [Acidobacteriota bacterium]
MTADRPDAAEAAQDRGNELFDGHRPLLFSIAYRMLGSVADAEDMVQEAFLRWQKTPSDEIKSPRAFLVTVVSRLCINQLQSARAKREEYFGPWLPEPILTGSAGDPWAALSTAESLSVAFLVLLERLTPTERAVFLLREVFDYGYPEIAEILGFSLANCRQLFRRARQHVTEGRPRFEPTPQERTDLLRHFLRAAQEGDMDGLVSLLAQDVVLYADGGGRASAVVNPIYGPDRVARFIVQGRRNLMPADVDRRETVINGQLGVVAYSGRRPFGVLTIDVAGGLIRNIFIVTNPEKLERLPVL